MSKCPLCNNEIENLTALIIQTHTVRIADDWEEQEKKAMLGRNISI